MADVAIMNLILLLAYDNYNTSMLYYTIST